MRQVRSIGHENFIGMSDTEVRTAASLFSLYRQPTIEKDVLHIL